MHVFPSTWRRTMLLAMSCLLVAGCARSAPEQARPAAATAGPGQHAAQRARTGPATISAAPVAISVANSSPAARPPSALPRMDVHKSPTCGCCKAWVEHVRKAGFEVRVHETGNLDPVKTRLGVPAGKGSCHTAEVGGYFVEGHVPAQDIKQLLARKPDAKGLALPGMPLGSPGMDLPDGRSDAFTVELIASDGSTSAFAKHAARPGR